MAKIEKHSTSRFAPFVPVISFLVRLHMHIHTMFSFVREASAKKALRVPHIVL